MLNFKDVRQHLYPTDYRYEILNVYLILCGESVDDNIETLGTEIVTELLESKGQLEE